MNRVSGSLSLSPTRVRRPVVCVTPARAVPFLSDTARSHGVRLSAEQIRQKTLGWAHDSLSPLIPTLVEGCAGCLLFAPFLILRGCRGSEIILFLSVPLPWRDER